MISSASRPLVRLALAMSATALLVACSSSPPPAETARVAAPPPAAAPAPPVPQTYVVFFGPRSFQLPASADPIVQAAADDLKQRAGYHLKVIGYDETFESEKAAQLLSDERAAAVKAALVKAGAPGDLISTEGRGKHELGVETADRVHEPRNRRARMVLYGPGE